ncbi:MAG: hypothetical protein FWG14_10025 [Peptococcaceae bacterium]|nr:hypothetical protein [Peptococcaceae bacterium]
MTSLTNLISDLSNSQNEIQWDDDYHSKFTDLFITNDRLFNILEKVGYKAVMGVAVTLTELIQLGWNKYFPHIDINEEFGPKNLSLWAAAIDPLYLKSFEFECEYFDEVGDIIFTPYAANWEVLYFLAEKYIKNSFTTHRYLINLSMLARHLTPNKKLFDKWFTETMRKTAEIFPCTYDYDDLDLNDIYAKYDCSGDAPCPARIFL